MVIEKGKEELVGVAAVVRKVSFHFYRKYLI